MNAPRLAVVILLTGATAGWAGGPLVCGGCRVEPRTLRQDATAARVVVYGIPTNANRVGTDGGTTDIVVVRVLKSDPIVAGKAVLRLDRFVELTDPAGPQAFLLFGDVTDGRVDFYRGEVAGPAVADYLAGSLAAGRDNRRVLRHCANYLDHHEPAVAADAFLELGRAADADLRAAGRGLDADRVRRLLRSKDTPAGPRGVCARLLAECGNRSDAPVLRELLDRWGDGTTGLDGVLTAYTLLDPPAGWAYVCDLVQDPGTDFLVRYTGLRAARFFQTDRPDVLPVADRLRAHAVALRHPDLADLVIDDLRKWRWWGLADEVLALPGRPEFADVPIVRRSVLLYALRCPGEPAARFVAAACAADPGRVAAAREHLAGEARAGK